MKLLVAVVAGGILSIAGMALLLPLPEIGLPLLLVGLRLLGRRFSWARRANARVDRLARRAADRYHRLPPALRLLALVTLAALAALTVVAVLLGIRHGPW